MDLYKKLFKSALRIRLVEKKIIELYPSDLIQSPVHLSIGQEAVAVGMCENLNVDDWVFINYRGHALYLAKGGNLDLFFAELMGRVTGVCKGKGGSMHLASPDHGVMGASAVVGSTISHAVGSALASKVRGEDRIFVTNFGDGATEQGSFHESLNLAALYDVPVVFLCEDNGLAVHAFKHERQSYNLEKLVKSYGIRYIHEPDGQDLMKVHSSCAEATKLARETGSPVFLCVRTARYKEHVGPGEDFKFGYRASDEIENWMKSDPLEMDFDLLSQFEPAIVEEIQAAVDFALASNFPGEGELLTDV